MHLTMNLRKFTDVKYKRKAFALQSCVSLCMSSKVGIRLNNVGNYIFLRIDHGPRDNDQHQQQQQQLQPPPIAPEQSHAVLQEGTDSATSETELW